MAVNTIKWEGGNTFTDFALNKLMADGFSKASGARDGVPKIAVVITDGNSTNPYMTNIKAQEAKSKEIHIFAIGEQLHFIHYITSSFKNKVCCETIYYIIRGIQNAVIYQWSFLRCQGCYPHLAMLHLDNISIVVRDMIMTQVISPMSRSQPTHSKKGFLGNNLSLVTWMGW